MSGALLPRSRLSRTAEKPARNSLEIPRPELGGPLEPARIGLVVEDVAAVRQLVSVAQASRNRGAGRQADENVAIGIHVVEAQLHLAQPGELPAELAEQVDVGVGQLGR